MSGKTVILLCLLLVTVNSNSLERFTDFDLITSVSAPRLLDDGILFTLHQDEGRLIFLRTNIDNWENDYYFTKSLYGILYTFVPYRYEKSHVEYKMNIDGFWETDPNNEQTCMTKYGTRNSVLTIPETVVYYRSYPLIEETQAKVKDVTFMYYNIDAEEVNLLTSADNFSPYSHAMRQDSYGYWKITMPFTTGTYIYYFLADGKKAVDVENPDRVIDPQIGDISVFTIR